MKFATVLGGCIIPSEGDRASAFERAIGPKAGQPGNGGGRLLSGAAQRPLSIAKQNSRP
ncbi:MULTISPECIES: hypothetical protein [Alphaproteobacteria]|uniref:hypothetical protein n=1 Tax=Alphaproteobacteria TaxID=28211 RepID=UPI0013DFA4C7|nr:MULTISPECIES: hypothetical protein [Alphaproteobacteria]